MQTHKCPVCNREGECIVSTDPHKCASCGAEWTVEGELVVIL